MADYLWPAEIVPYSVTFYLQPHTGGSESPFNRTSKIYALSAPRWICRMAFRGGDSDKWGTSGAARYGPALDALIARLKGRQNRVGVYDFRRTALRGLSSTGVSNQAAALGATSMVITGLSPGAVVLAGDYLGGDNRPHIVVEDATANGSGQATVKFEPPLAAAIGAGAVVLGNPRGWFRLTDDNAGMNVSTVGELTTYDLDLVEDVSGIPIATINQTLTINGVPILFGGSELEMA